MVVKPREVLASQDALGVAIAVKVTSVE